MLLDDYAEDYDRKLLRAIARREERAILLETRMAEARRNADASRNLAEAWVRAPIAAAGHVAPELIALKRHLDAEFARAMRGEGATEPLGILSDPDLDPDGEEVAETLEMIEAATARAGRVSGTEFFTAWAITQGFGTAERAREAGFRLEPCSCCLPECAGWRVVR